jgi:predicted dehydrogenase
MALRFAILGAGFWSRFQLAGWKELEGVRCVAICDLVSERAETRAAEFQIPAFYTDAEALFKRETLDFVDIVTPVETHRPLVELAASYGLNIVCQKPMGVDLGEAEHMLRVCEQAGVQLLINENWRWQYPIRQFKRYLDSGNIGKPFRARIHYVSSFPFYINQPSLKDLEQFILADMGSHLLDAARFLFGEADSLYCQTHRIHPDIKGEDARMWRR